MGGGGGSAGQVGYPDYMEAMHDAWLDDIDALITSYISSSPYDGAVAYDPTTQLSAMSSAISALKALIDAVDNESDVESAIDAAAVKAEALFDNADAVTEFFYNYDTAATKADSAVSNAAANGVVNAAALDAAGSVAALASVEAALDAALAKINGFDVSTLDDLVESFSDSGKRELLQALSRFSGMMVGLNAVNSSAFYGGIAMIESDFLKSISAFRADQASKITTQFIGSYIQGLTALFGIYVQAGVTFTQTEVQALLTGAQAVSGAVTSNRANKAALILNATKDMVSLLSSTLSMYGGYTEQANNYYKAHIVAKQEQADRDIELDALDAMYPFELLLKGGQLLSTINGAAVVPEKPSRMQSAIGGMLTGGAMGFQAGGPVGALVGLGLGAFL